MGVWGPQEGSVAHPEARSRRNFSLRVDMSGLRGGITSGAGRAFSCSSQRVILPRVYHTGTLVVTRLGRWGRLYSAQRSEELNALQGQGEEGMAPHSGELL